MQLVVNTAIVAGFKPTQKALLNESRSHADITFILFGSSARKQLLNLFGEIVVLGFAEVIGGIALSFEVIVLGDIFVKLAAEERAVFSRHIFAH